MQLGADLTRPFRRYGMRPAGRLLGMLDLQEVRGGGTVLLMKEIAACNQSIQIAY